MTPSANENGTTNDMVVISSELPERLNCPVCKAGQEPSQVCRRCGADLDLFLRCLISRHRAQRRHQAALECGDQATADRMQEYLRWLGGRP